MTVKDSDLNLTYSPESFHGFNNMRHPGELATSSVNGMLNMKPATTKPKPSAQPAPQQSEKPKAGS